MNCRLVVAFLLFDRVYWTRGRGQRGSAAARQCGSVAVWRQCGRRVAAEWLGPGCGRWCGELWLVVLVLVGRELWPVGRGAVVRGHWSLVCGIDRFLLC